MTRCLSIFIAITLQAQTPRDLKFERTTSPLPDKRVRWALVVGVSSYKYAPPHAQLKFAHRDAQEFANLLRSAEGGAMPAGNVRLLTEESATVGGIRAAMHSWLARSAGSNDIVYIFFAGHAVEGERGETYFVAHDSDPQNLHATGIPFKEVNDVLTNKVRAATVVLFADACHAGGIGWTSDPSSRPVAAPKSLEALGARDRSFLKLLAARPSEQSFEDERWGGGHGIFTYSVLTALRGAAERDRDGVVRVSELIDYVSRVVPEQTGTKQNPRVAGNFEAAMPLAAVRTDAPRPLPVEPPSDAALLRLQASIRSGNVIGPGGAWEQYQAQTFAPANAAPATAIIMAALEDTGMECVSDYVQSTTNALKRPMFLRAAEAFTVLGTLRPGDASLQAKALFCRARAHIAANEFTEAIQALNRSLAIEPDFACSHNALGVALGRVGKNAEARTAFEAAAKLTPEWALPLMQIAQQLINAGDLRGAVPYLEKASKLNPKATGIHWSLARVHRLLGNSQDFVRTANLTIAADRNYAPIYAELGMFYDSVRDTARAAQAYDNYLLLAPNFADSAEVRKRVQAIRSPAPQPPKPAQPPTLRREGDKKK